MSPVVYCCEPFFFFHIINAFQPDSSYVCIDIVAYKDAEVRIIYTKKSCYSIRDNLCSLGKLVGGFLSSLIFPL